MKVCRLESLEYIRAYFVAGLCGAAGMLLLNLLSSAPERNGGLVVLGCFVLICALLTTGSCFNLVAELLQRRVTERLQQQHQAWDRRFASLSPEQRFQEYRLKTGEALGLGEEELVQKVPTQEPLCAFFCPVSGLRARADGLIRLAKGADQLLVSAEATGGGTRAAKARIRGKIDLASKMIFAPEPGKLTPLGARIV